jgi:hypothetical protein
LELSDAVAIADKAAAGKAISGGLVKEGEQLNFVVVLLSDDQVKEVFLEPRRASSKRYPAGVRKNSIAPVPKEMPVVVPNGRFAPEAAGRLGAPDQSLDIN